MEKYYSYQEDEDEFDWKKLYSFKVRYYNALGGWRIDGIMNQEVTISTDL